MWTSTLSPAGQGLVALLLAGVAVAQNVSPSNDSRLLQADGQLQLVLKTALMPATQLAQVQPLTTAAGLGQPASALKNIRINGTLVLADALTAANLSSADIAWINCEPSAYPAGTTASSVLSLAAAHHPAAVVLYSALSNHCNVTIESGFTYSSLFTLAGNAMAGVLENALKTTPPALAQAFIAQDANDTATNATAGAGATSNANGGGGMNGGAAGSGPGNGGAGNSILGTSPTTAVAMIILYSITGVITALFLVIIVTGAVRAHRHPERYGPRLGGNGRTRQSRARGIARAMLDTLPIVKFGEKDETPKPATADVELGHASREAQPEGSDETAEPVGTTVAPATGVAPLDPTEGTGDGSTALAASDADGTTTNRASTAVEAVDAIHEAPNDRDAASAANAAEPAPETSPDDSLGCSICTEDFVKGEDVRVLPCDHKYHPECIDPWLLNVSGTCPLCRIDLRPQPLNSEDALSASGGGSHASGPESTSRSHHHRGHPVRDGESSGEHARPRVSRYLEFHLGLTPASDPEERIAALLRLRDDSRRGHTSHRRRSASSRRTSGSHLQVGGGGGGGGSGAGASNNGGNSRRHSRISVLLRDAVRRRSARVDGSDEPAASSSDGAGSSTPEAAIPSEVPSSTGSGSESRSGSVLVPASAADRSAVMTGAAPVEAPATTTTTTTRS
ncbi:MAG: hypothetical protein M1826_006122 [Phylliscum demangeonii]|nr:MAG: hypothetical protein M1826_006122 [Phylliscum demangeonii]